MNAFTAKEPLTHAREREVWYNQKTVVAVCGIKARVSNTTYLPLGLAFNCVGCRAIISERLKEEIRETEGLAASRDTNDPTAALARLKELRRQLKVFEYVHP